jgi:hypothetical protein
MKQPCNNCPFLKEPAFHGLSQEKAKSILDEINGDSAFHCHKTVDYSDGNEGTITKDSKLCLGAAIFLEKTRDDGGLRANRGFRLGLMVKEFEMDELVMTAPVYDSAEEFLKGTW